MAERDHIVRKDHEHLTHSPGPVMQDVLTDAFHREHTYLRISVTDRCNLRCRYCMPEEDLHLQQRDDILTFEEILRLTRIFAGMGVRKVRLTGGEPLVRRDLPHLVEQLTRIDGIETVGLTTNGVLLQRYAADLKRAGLTALNVSLDTLRPERFIAVAQRDEFAAVMDGIATAMQFGFRPLKLNTVVMKGVNDDEILDFVYLTRKLPLNVRFIEYMPFGDNGWNAAGFMPFSVMRERIAEAYTLMPVTETAPHAVAKDFRVPGFRGAVSFISSMSEHFCGSCNRVRLTADGIVKPCLFSTAETDLRSILRAGGTDGQIAAAVRHAVEKKWHAHPPVEDLRRPVNRVMVQIGG